jgi:SAM-dependent methyltransferase
VHGDRARLYAQPVQSLQEAVFDAAVAMEVLEHIPDAQIAEVLEAVRCRLRPDGVLVVSVPQRTCRCIQSMSGTTRHPSYGVHLEPSFEIEDLHYVHRNAMVSRNLRRVMTNRLMHLNEPRLIRRVVRSYQRRAWSASPDDGTHIVAHRISAACDGCE